MSSELVIARDRSGIAVKMIRYQDEGVSYVDLQMDGRLLLTPDLARKIAKRLNAFAEVEEYLRSPHLVKG